MSQLITSKPLPFLLEVIQSYSRQETIDFTGSFNYAKGKAYFTQGRILRFSWDSSLKSLSSTVQGTRAYQVKLFLDPDDESQIQGYCSCPAWEGWENCKHVACVLIGIRKWMSEGFNPAAQSYNKQIEELLSFRSFPQYSDPRFMTSRPQTSKSVLQIFLKNDWGGNLVVECRKGNKLIDALGLNNHFNLYDLEMSEETELALLDFLYQSQSQEFEIWIQTDEGNIKAHWDPKTKLHTSLSFHLLKDQNLEIRFQASIDSVSIPKFYILGNFICFDPKSASLLVPEGNEALSFYYALTKKIREQSWDFEDFSIAQKPVFKPVQPSKVPSEKWTYFGLIMSSKLFKETSFYSQDVRQNPIHETPEFRLEIEQEPWALDRYTLQALWRIDGKDIFENRHPFYLLVQMVKNHPDLSSMTPNDRQRVYQALLESLDLPNAKEQAHYLKEFLNSLSFRYYSKKESSLLLKILKKWADPDTNPFQPFVKKGSWHVIEFDILQALRLLGTAALNLSHSPSLLLIENEQKKISVPVKKILSRLLDLKKSIEDLGGSLYWKRKQIKLSSLEVSIDASVSSQDWFEIRPEIKLNGKPLHEKEWQKILESSFLENQTGIHILDSNALEILNRLKRSFASKSKTPKSNPREFVSIPRLEIFDLLSLRKLGARVRFSETDERILKNLTHLETIPVREIPTGFQGELRDYQKRGFDWLCFLYEHRFGACLADDMGLGKTVQALSFLAALKDKKLESPFPETSKPHLIVVPPSLVFNWENEIRKFYPQFRVKLYIQPFQNLLLEDCDIVLGTYDRVRLDIETLEKTTFHVILFDEAQWIKNIFAARTNAVRRLKGNFKICLTGTPLENHVGEYYSVMDLCLPGLLGDPKEFRILAQDENRSIFLNRTRPFVLRRLKENILKELPPKVETEVYLDLTEEQKQFYHKMVSEVRSEIENAYLNKTEAQARIIALTAILRLRQICVSSRLLNPDSKETSPKLEFMKQKLFELRDEGYACVIFSQFTRFLDIAEEALKDSKLDYLRMDGKTPIPKRKSLVERFQDLKGPAIFLVSLKTGGVGLNLTRASYVLHLDPWWNPAVDQQASDRVHRIGQTQSVFVHRILMRHTIEEKMMSLRQSKLELFKNIMDDQANSGMDLKITKADFDFLLT